jgi:hypothetical protein
MAVVTHFPNRVTTGDRTSLGALSKMTLTGLMENSVRESIEPQGRISASTAKEEWAAQTQSEPISVSA